MMVGGGPRSQSWTGRASVLAAQHLVRTHGTLAQQEQLLVCRQPGAIKRLAREILFRPFFGFERWNRIEPDEIPHLETCVGGEVGFAAHTTDREPDDRETWASLQLAARGMGVAEGARPSQVFVILRRHVGRCTCGGKAQSLSALVTCYWAGWSFSREYAL